MYCRKCGKQIDYDSEYCNECKNDQLFFDGKSVLSQEEKVDETIVKSEESTQEKENKWVKEVELSEKALFAQKMAKESDDKEEKRRASKKFKTSIIALSLSFAAFILSYISIIIISVYLSDGTGYVEDMASGITLTFIALGLTIAGLVLGIKAIKNFRTLLRKVSKAKGIISLVFGISSVSLCAINMLFLLIAFEFSAFLL